MGLIDAIAGIFSGLGDTATKIRTAITGKDPAIEGQVEILQTQIQAAAQAAAAAVDAAQSDYDKATLGVTGTNFFKFWVAGPKPALFWVCVIAFFLQYCVVPIASWFGATLKPIDLSLPSQIALALAGVGSIAGRVVEKVTGAQGNH